MDLDETVMQEACQKFRDTYSMSAKDLGYDCLKVEWRYSKSFFEAFFEREPKKVIYVTAEFYKPLFERGKDRRKLRKLIPSKFPYNGDVINVFLDYYRLSYDMKRTMKQIKKAQTELKLEDK